MWRKSSPESPFNDAHLWREASDLPPVPQNSVRDRRTHAARFHQRLLLADTFFELTCTCLGTPLRAGMCGAGDAAPSCLGLSSSRDLSGRRNCPGRTPYWRDTAILKQPPNSLRRVDMPVVLTNPDVPSSAAWALMNRARNTGNALTSQRIGRESRHSSPRIINAIAVHHSVAADVSPIRQREHAFTPRPRCARTVVLLSNRAPVFKAATGRLLATPCA